MLKLVLSPAKNGGQGCMCGSGGRGASRGRPGVRCSEFASSESFIAEMMSRCLERGLLTLEVCKGMHRNV